MKRHLHQVGALWGHASRLGSFAVLSVPCRYGFAFGQSFTRTNQFIGNAVFADARYSSHFTGSNYLVG